MKQSFVICWSYISFALLLLWGSIPTGQAKAVSLSELLPDVLANHDRIKKEEANLESVKQDVKVALGGWYPSLGLKANFGEEHQDNPVADDTNLDYQEVGVSVTQLITDFGVTNSTVKKARLKLEQANLNLLSEKQKLISDAVTAYIDLIRAWRILEYARQSEKNIRQQTGLEEVRVTVGGGFSTDVLQSKTQLASAEARKIRGEGKLDEAKNRFWTIFNYIPTNTNISDLKPYTPQERDLSLPGSLKEAIVMAKESNFSIQLARNTVAKAETAWKSSMAKGFLPKVEFSANMNVKNNVAGTEGRKIDKLWKIEANMPFNLGFTAVNKVKSSYSSLSSSKMKLSDTIRNTEEKTRNAWRKITISQNVLQSLEAQAGIAASFLELSRQERELGQRSLIDVLAGETSLINAQSDAESAKTDVLMAIIALKKNLGQLNIKLFERELDN